MATLSAFHFMFLFSLVSLSNALVPKPHGFILPIEKDKKSLQYSTSIRMGTPPVNLELVVDIRERFLWFECGNSYNSSTYQPVRCGTKKCKLAKSTDCITCTNHPLKTGCTNNTCGLQPFNPFGEFYVSGDLGQDFLSSIYSTDGARFLSNTRVPHFLSSCVYPNKFGVQGFLQGLAKGKKGILGLAKTPIALHKQLATKYKLDHKFALCLPSKKNGGSLVVGGGPYNFLPTRNKVSEFLKYTPLIVNPSSTGPIFDDDPSNEYFLDLKSIKIDDEIVNFNTSLLSFDKFGNGGTKLSTVIPHTKLDPSIFKPFVEAFMKKAKLRKIKKVKEVAPFGACFDAKTVGKSKTGGADVPTIDLVLEGGVQWTIYGENSMVRVDRNVLCLGFVDAGTEQGAGGIASVVIGGHQLEDNLLEFDLVSSRLGFSSSLLLHDASCSHRKVF